MIFGVNPTKDAVVIAQATGSGETFVIKSIRSIQFQARSGDELNELLQRLVIIFVLKKVLGCAPGQKWQARAEERFNPGSSRKNWSHGAVGAAAAAFKIAEGQPTGIRSAIISLCAADTDSRGESRSLKSTSTASREKKTGLLASMLRRRSPSPSSASIRKSRSANCP